MASHSRTYAWWPRLAWLLPLGAAIWAVAIATGADLPEPVTRDPTEPRFGVPLAQRERIWRDISVQDPHWRRLGKRYFPHHVWSQYDLYANHANQHIMMLAAREQLSVTQIHLIQDEGLFNGWPAPNGKPLEAKWVPLDPRRE